MVSGLIIGAIGDGRGALVGAMVGAGVGWVLPQKLRGAGDERLEKLESAIRLLQQRIGILENERRTTVRAETAPAAEPREPARAHAVDVMAPRAPADLFAPPAAPSSMAVEPESEPPAALEANAPPLAAEPSEIRPTLSNLPPQASALWNFFFGGNTLVRFGGIVLFFGVAFLLKYAAENIEVPIEARLTGVSLGAVLMLAVGWRLRVSRPGYALIAQGGGIGILCLTVFAAFRLYQLLPGGLVFVLRHVGYLGADGRRQL